MSSNKIALVIGGNGFIGSLVVKALKKYSIDHAAVSRKDCNLLSLEEVKKNLLPYKSKNLDIIFTASIVRRKQDSKSALEDNILMMSNFIQSVSQHHINSFIFISSIDVYLNNDFSLDESTLLSPNNPYSISKLCSEAMLHKAFKDQLTILRLPGVYGIDDKNGSIVGKFTELIKNNVCLKLFNKGLQYRDYLYVEDIPRAILRFLENPSSGIFNLSTGKSMRIVEIIKIISDELGRTPLIEESKVNSSQVNIKISNKKFLEEYPSFTFTSMKSGIKKYIKELN
ncbi:NAD(P)-dependent oxidoreductase [bacterium]|nr:NAD(P)-dependent oxidoreductase [bacterium]